MIYRHDGISGGVDGFGQSLASVVRDRSVHLASGEDGLADLRGPEAHGAAVPRLVLMSAGMPPGLLERDRVVCAMANDPGAATDTEPHSCDAYAVMWRRSLPYIDLAPFVNSAVQCSVS